ncbi:MAG TPA: hypothetical protein VGO93_11920 [Candidatus Xenobia bacterium]
MRRVELALTAVGVVVLFLYMHFDLWGDGLVRYRALDALLGHGALAAQKYSLIGPLFSAPLWYLGKVCQTSEWWCARYNFFLFTGALLVWWRLPEAWVPGRLRTRFLLILVVASMFASPHLESYYGEPFTVLLASFALLALAHDYPRTGLVLLFLSAANAPATLPAVVLAAVAHGWHSRRWSALGVVPVAAGVVVAEGLLHGGWHGYVVEAANGTPFPVGLLSLTLSFGKGILFFAPGLWLCRRALIATLPDALAHTLHLWLWYVLGLLLFYASWWDWSGDFFWGPRFMLMAALPASLLMAAALETPGQVRSLLVLSCIVAWSVWVAAEGTVFGPLDTAAYQNETNIFCYVPDYSVLLRPLCATVVVNGADKLMLGWSVGVLALLLAPVIKAGSGRRHTP